MSDKERAIEMIRNMPDSKPFAEILADLFFREQVNRGLRDVEAGRTLTEEEARKRLAKWLRP